MNKTIFVLLTAIGSFAFGGFIAVIRFLRERNRRNHMVCNFFEIYEDNEPQNPDEFERYFAGCGLDGESDE